MSSILPILIANKDKECTESRVRNIVPRSFLHIDDIEVTDVWLDPFEARRAVALVDFQSLEYVSQSDTSDQQSYLLAWADPATSLLVNTNGIPSLEYGINDKLKMLFTIKKRGGSSVQFVEPWRSPLVPENDKNYFEVGFKNGWAAVLKASSHIWTVGGEKLTVIPLFSCFQKDLDSQFLELTFSKSCINAPQHFDTEADEVFSKQNSQTDTNQMKADEKTENSKSGGALTSSSMETLERESAIHFPKSVPHNEAKDSSRNVLGFERSIKQIECPNHFLGWLLSVVEYDSICEIHVIFDNIKEVVQVTTADENKEGWFAAMAEESLHIQEMLEYEEYFLIDVKSDIKSRLSKYKIALDIGNSKLLISKTDYMDMDQSDCNVTLETWIASLIEKQCIPNIPNEWFKDDSAYKEVKELHSDIRFVCCENEVSLILLTLSSHDAKKCLTRAAVDIKNVLILYRKSLKYKAYKKGAEKHLTFPEKTTDSSMTSQENNHDWEMEVPQTLGSQIKIDNPSLYQVSKSSTTNTEPRQPNPKTKARLRNDSSEIESEIGFSLKGSVQLDDMVPNDLVQEISNYQKMSSCLPTLARNILTQYDTSGRWSEQEGNNNKIYIGLNEIKCFNIFLGWLLSEVDYESTTGIKVDFNDQNRVVSVQTEDNNKADWYEAIIEETNHIQEMPEYVETFLMKMISLIKLSLSEFKLALCLDFEKAQLILKPKRMEMEQNIALQSWITSLTEKECFSDIPNAWLEDDSAYREVKELHHNVKFVSCKSDRSLTLLALSWDEEKKSLSAAASSIRNLLILSRKLLKVQDIDVRPESATVANYGEKQRPQAERKVTNYFVEWPLMYLDFLNKFLWEKLKAIESKHPPLQINVQENGLQLLNFFNVDEVKYDLVSLRKQIKLLQKPFVFPGLSLFLRKEGLDTLSNISQQFQCHISPSPPSSESSVELIQISDRCYNGILIGTARKRQRNVHLVQGEQKNMKVDMVVDVYASTEVHEAALKPVSSGERLVLFLPEWSSPKGIKCHNLFEMQRQRLTEAFTLIFQQADHFRHQRIAIFTNSMRKIDHANFPVEDFAEAFGHAMWSVDSIDNLDVFICDTSAPLVFKAFDYMFGRQRVAFRPSDEKDWDVIKSEETSSVPDYSSLCKNRHISVTVSKQTWSHYPQFTQDNLLCLPVVMSMDHVTVPFIGPDDQQNLEKSIFAKDPDGLLPGQAEFFSSFRPGKKFLVYCCSPWGFDADKTLVDALTNCFYKGSSYRKINFVPPLAYPYHYVAQKVFQSLDTFTESFHNSTQITIWVENNSQQKLFEDELKKRKPEQKGYFDFKKIFSHFLPESKESGGSLDGTKVTVTQTKKTEISFLSLNGKNNDEASNALFWELKSMISLNTKELKLDPRKIDNISSLEKMVKNHPNISANLKHQISRKKSKRKGKGKASQTLNLTVSALTEDILAEFIHSLQLAFGSDIISDSKHFIGSFKNSEPAYLNMETETNSGTEEKEKDQKVSRTKADESNNAQALQVLENFESDGGKFEAEYEIKEHVQSQATDPKDPYEEQKSSFDQRKFGENVNDENSGLEKIERKKFNTEGQVLPAVGSSIQEKQESEMQSIPSDKKKRERKSSKSPQIFENNENKNSQKEYFVSEKVREENFKETSNHPHEIIHNPKEKRQEENMAVKLALGNLGDQTGKGELAFDQQDAGKKKADLNIIDYDYLPITTSNNEHPKDACNYPKEDNVVETSMEWENIDPETMGPQRFVWMFQSHTESAWNFAVVKFCSPKFNQALECAYLEGKTGYLQIGTEHVDLSHMTAKSKDNKKRLFRMEVFDQSSLEAVECPHHWCKTGFRTVDIDINNGHYKNIHQSLQNASKSFEFKIIKVEALENPVLFRKYRCKQRQVPDLKDTIMWHRVSPENKGLACQYGLHYNFMAIPLENRPECGAVCCFFENPEQCFTVDDSKSGTLACLVRAAVLVHQVEAYQAISSDAQAYPMHFITVRIKRAKS